MKRFLRNLLIDWPILAIIAVALIVAITNFKPGTFLTGWDNLHPEFNFSMNITRALQSTWQEYQGLGLLAGMGHASDLPRELFLWLVSAFLPQNTLRYFYHFLMLPVGMLGIYFLLSRVLLTSYSEKTRKLSGFIGSLFYLLNLGTIQYFYVPFEPYSTFWGLFPWEIYTLLTFIHKPSKKTLGIFALANILAIPQAYVQTIFLVYLLCVGVILAISYLAHKSKAFLKTAGLALATIFVVNAFWLLPNLYFVATNLSVTQDAVQNQMATEKFFQMNKARGTIADLPLLREFYFDFFDYNKDTGKFDYLMKSWRDQFTNPFIMIAGYMLFAVAAFGILATKKHRNILWGLSGLCLIVFLASTPGIELLNSLFRALPVVNQIFRNPFTKFIVPLITLYGLGLGLGVAYLSDRLQKVSKGFLLPSLVAVFLILLTTFPVFRGDFLASTMRVAIPKEYFDLFEYFAGQDKDARIMNLPQGSFWGWYYYRFGIRGSGFLWYGIEQPILDRAFDVWSRENENYYWELSYALQKRDQHLFNSLLEKYQVQYILFDENILFADNINSVRYAFNQESLVKQNAKLHQSAHFGNLTVYQVALENKPTHNVISSTQPPQATTSIGSEHVDQAFQSVGFYQEPVSSTAQPDLTYPFAGLFTARSVTERNFNVSQDSDETTLSAELPNGDYTLNLPAFTQTAKQLPVTVKAKRVGAAVTVDLALLSPKITIGDQTLTTPLKHQEVTFSTPASLKSFYLSINNADFFELKNLTSTYQEVGHTYLQNAENVNYLRLYQGTEKISQTLSPTSFDKAKICGQVKSTSAVSSIPDQNGILLTARDTANCTVFSSPFTGYENSLIKVRLNYTSSSDEFPQFCYYSSALQTCLNKKDIPRTGFNRDNGVMTDFFEGYSGKDDKGFFHLVLEGQGDEDKGRDKAITYSSIHLTAYPYIGGTSLTLSGLQDTSEQQDVHLGQRQTLRVTLPTPEAYASYTHPLASNLYKTGALNYDTVLPGKYSLEEVETEPKRLRTSAADASSYLLLRANNLNSGNGYLLRLDTQHEQGFPFTVNVFTNQEFRSYVYTYASSQKGTLSEYFILPPLYEFDRGISVLLGSNSYNATPSVNDLVDVTIQPLPFDYLTQLRLTKKQSSLAQASLTGGSVAKQSLTRYIVHPSAKTSFLTLSQSYNPGWQAYIVSQSDSKLLNSVKEALPTLFGKKLIHTKVNSWENGWILPASAASSTVVITFLPQFLEVFGLLIFLIAIAACGLYYGFPLLRAKLDKRKTGMLS